MDSSNGHNNFIDVVKLIEQAHCYDEMVDAVKKVVTFNVELTLKETHLTSSGYKNMFGATRE